jgi:hypothetical protein
MQVGRMVATLVSQMRVAASLFHGKKKPLQIQHICGNVLGSFAGLIQNVQEKSFCTLYVCSPQPEWREVCGSVKNEGRLIPRGNAALLVTCFRDTCFSLRRRRKTMRRTL